ncbi:hypothetical protein BDR03DRAFT_449082 [Suillus americanus]|nr:hypothetical protein BDR03DRAFT_449082 [Suillus americanus]
MSRDCVNTDQFDPGWHLLPNGELSPTARIAGSPFFEFGRRVCPGRVLAEVSCGQPSCRSQQQCTS